jgi:hypothetical protein
LKQILAFYEGPQASRPGSHAHVPGHSLHHHAHAHSRAHWSKDPLLQPEFLAAALARLRAHFGLDSSASAGSGDSKGADSKAVQAAAAATADVDLPAALTAYLKAGSLLTDAQLAKFAKRAATTASSVALRTPLVCVRRP